MSLSSNPRTSALPPSGSPLEAEALFKEARRRARRRRARRGLVSLGALALVAGLVIGAARLVPLPSPSGESRSASLPVKPEASLLSCSNRAVVRPASFVISCADGNALLSATHWSSWSPAAAVGVATFELNLCTPTCAASRLTAFPGATVRLTEPLVTRRGTLFALLEVTYPDRGRLAHFSMSFTGTPPFTAAR